MRVLVASSGIGGLSSARTGAALARAWAQLGAEVAVVPIGEAGEGFLEALAALWGVEPAVVDVPGADVSATVVLDPARARVAVGVPARDIDPWHGQSTDLGHALNAALNLVGDRPLSVYLDLASNRCHDGGRGMLAAVGHRDLGGVHLVGVVPAEEAAQPLAGLRGIVSRDGRPAGLDVAELLAADQVLVALADELSRAGGAAAPLVDAPGAGACGGAGLGILALGGRVEAAPDVVAGQAGLPDTVRHADLVVTGCHQLHFGTMGGTAMRAVVDLAGSALRPVIALAGTNHIGARELRSVGIEQAYSLFDTGAVGEGALADDLATTLTAAAVPIARNWWW